jgi:hypothetical protein
MKYFRIQKYLAELFKDEKTFKRGDVIHVDSGEIRYYRTQDRQKAFVTTPYGCKIRVLSFEDEGWVRVRITVVPESQFVFDSPRHMSFLAYMETDTVQRFFVCF